MEHQTVQAHPTVELRRATTKRIRRACWGWLITFACLLFACGEEPLPHTSACGAGDVRLDIGIDDPWLSTPDLRFSVDEGLQGGYHIDVSVKAVGTLDPDSVNILLELDVGGRRIARHLTDDWLLKIYPDDGHCEYPRARLVFTDAEGGLMPLDEVETLIGQTGRLRVSMESPDGGGEAVFDIHLDRLVRRE